MKKIKQVIRGEYVATPIKNAFNEKTSYWFSKNGYTISMYMFTVDTTETDAEFEERLSEDGFKAFIPMLEERCRRPHNGVIYEEEWNKVHESK